MLVIAPNASVLMFAQSAFADSKIIITEKSSAPRQCIECFTANLNAKQSFITLRNCVYCRVAVFFYFGIYFDAFQYINPGVRLSGFYSAKIKKRNNLRAINFYEWFCNKKCINILTITLFYVCVVVEWTVKKGRVKWTCGRKNINFKIKKTRRRNSALFHQRAWKFT